MPVCDFTNFPKKDMLGKFIVSEISFIVMFEYLSLYGAQNEVYNDDWVKSGLIVLCFS